MICLCDNQGAGQLYCNREAVRYIESTTNILSLSKISSLQPSSVDIQPGLCWTWSETPKTEFLTPRQMSLITRKPVFEF